LASSFASSVETTLLPSDLFPCYSLSGSTFAYQREL
jgi:hypothetical protein